VSVGIHWQPVKSDGTRVRGQSRVVAQIKAAFGRFPLDMTETDLPKLEAMAVVDPEGPWSEFVEAIQKVGDIHVWGEY
jgi:hypothetical protein